MVMVPEPSSATSCMVEKVARSQLESYEMAAGIRILWRCHACGRLPLLARGHPDRPLTNTPFPVHRPPDPSITETGPLTPSTGTLVRLRLTPVVHALGPKPRPWAPRGIHGSARGAPTPATIEKIIQLLFLFFPVADFRLGRRFQTAGMLLSPHV